MSTRYLSWGLLVCGALGICLAVGAARGAGEEVKPSGVSEEAYADLMANEALDLKDLAEGAEIQRRMFNHMTPSEFSWLQPMFPSVAPFDAKYFDGSFLDGLLGEETNSVAVYPLSLVLDPKTRETLIYNAEGKLIATIPADGKSRTWSEDADPARVTLRLDLLPSEDVEPYLYTEDRVAEADTSMASKSAKIGKIGRRNMMVGNTNFGISGFQHLTNGNVRLTVTNGADIAEVFSYTEVHTSSVQVVGWTNELGMSSPTNVIWTPVSPTFNGLESDWQCQETNLALTNGVGVWEDSNISSNDRVRFYGVANRTDTDGDGLTDGMELFVYHTSSTNADTDGDGHSDGREIALETDPLDGSDYFGIVINAALPITNLPANPGEWVELFNVGPNTKSLAGFRLQTAQTNGWTNVFTFPAGTTLDSGDFLVVGTNGDYQAALGMPDCPSTPPVMFGIRLVAPSPSTFVADALLYGFTNVFGFSLDGFGEELPILRPIITNVIRRTWIGYDTDHAGDWKNVPSTSWFQHTQGDYLDLDGDGLSNAQEIAGGLYPNEGGSRIDDTDTDSDGLSDAEEVANGTDPNNVDTDGDAFPWDTSVPPRGNDADELASGTDPLNADMDGDGIPDGWELAGGLDPTSTDSDDDAMPDANEDSDTNGVDGIPNAVEVGNLTNPFDAGDVDPRPYLWNGGDPGDEIDEGDIGYGTTLTYHIVTQSNSQPIIVTIQEGGFRVEDFDVECDVDLIYLNPDDVPATNREYCIVPGLATNFEFRIIDGKTTWQNENASSYGADIRLQHEPTSINLDAGVAEESEESVGFVLANKSAHPGAVRHALSIEGPVGDLGYASNVVLTYDIDHLQIYGGGNGSNAIPNGTVFPASELPTELFAEGIAHSGMQGAWVEIVGSIIPVHDRVTATVLKADIGAVSPLADRTLHLDAERRLLLLKQTLPGAWNGLMQLSISGAVAYWTATGGVPIVLGETVFTNAQLAQTIYLEGDECGEGQASFSVVGLSDCVTNIPLQIFGVNATLDGVAELDEESPGGFIADHTVHTNAPRTLLALDACGPDDAEGDVTLTWDSSLVRIYSAASGGTALSQFNASFSGFNGTNLYVEGIAPGSNTLSWSYSEQSDCEDLIQVTVLKVDLNIWNGGSDLDNGQTAGSQGSQVADADEETVGAYLLVNWDDDDADGAMNNNGTWSALPVPDLTENSVANEDNLAQLKPTVQPLLDTGTIELEVSGTDAGKVKLWTQNTKGTQVALASNKKTWNLADSAEKTDFQSFMNNGYWIEGITVGTTERGAAFTLRYKDSGGTEICNDVCNATVVMINLANAVARDNMIDLWGIGQNSRGHISLVWRYAGTCTKADLTNDVNFILIEMGGPTDTRNLTTITQQAGYPAYGCFRNPSMTYVQRLQIIRAARALADRAPITYTATDAVSPNNWDGALDTITGLRCDSLVEVCYEIIGVDAWGMEREPDSNTVHYDIDDQADNWSYSTTWGTWTAEANNLPDNLEEHNNFDLIGWADTFMPATQCGNVAPVDADTQLGEQNLCQPIGSTGGN